MAEKIVYAKHKNFGQPPRKVRWTVDQIRGAMVDDAITTLKFLNKKAAPAVLKVIESAAANATNNNGMQKANLVICEARVDEGLVRKKVRYRGRGGQDLEEKRYSHIVIGVKEREVVK